MGGTNSKTSGHSSTALKAKQSSVHPVGTSGDGKIKVSMVQNVLLVWLDCMIDDNSSDCRNTITQLRRIVNTVNTFTDSEQCIEFMELMKTENICLIISGTLGQSIVPRVHNLPQVNTIFVFCMKKPYHQQWAKSCSKVKGVFNQIKPICEALKQTTQQCEQSAISISIMATEGDIAKKI